MSRMKILSPKVVPQVVRYEGLLPLMMMVIAMPMPWLTFLSLPCLKDEIRALLRNHKDGRLHWRTHNRGHHGRINDP